MARLAVVGSCITRDLWPLAEDAPADLLYISRTSLASLMSPPLGPVTVAETPREPLKRHTHNALVADLRKTALAELVAHRPTHIIFDFIDERFDLLARDGRYVTDSWELEVSGYREQPGLAGARRIGRLSPAADQAWRLAVLQLAGLIQSSPLSHAQIILHQSQWAATYFDADGTVQAFAPELEVYPGRTAELVSHNRLLRRCETWFTAALPQTCLVSVKAPVAEATHRWGLSPFHYTPAYYEAIRLQLAGLGV